MDRNQITTKRKLQQRNEYWKRSCRLSRMDRITNDDVRRRLKVEKDVLVYSEERRLVWHGHVRRSGDVWQELQTAVLSKEEEGRLEGPETME